MEKSFIERLTDEQITTFLERNYPKEKRYSYYTIRNKEFISVHVDENFGDCLFCITLCEYDTIGYSRPCIWIKYLYEVFGQEYKEAYLNRCAKIFD